MKAFITGITGQDGSYLTDLLLSKGYEVHGLIRRSSTFETERLENHPHDKGSALFLHHGDLTDSASILSLIRDAQPDEVYNLGAQSHVAVSFENPIYTANVDAIGCLACLEAIRHLNKRPKFYQASSSEMYGLIQETPQTEKTPFHPRSPYACAKLYSYWQTRNYREAYGIFGCNGILFNHESPRRAETFVTRKITRAATRIKLGLQKKLSLGNLDAKRDWGFAGDYVEAMWMMLQQGDPDDYVIATGKTHSVRDFLLEVFEQLDLKWESYVEQDNDLFRPAEVYELTGDFSKAWEKIGWKPKVDFKSLVKLMVDADMKLAQREAGEKI